MTIVNIIVALTAQVVVGETILSSSLTLNELTKIEHWGAPQEVKMQNSPDYLSHLVTIETCVVTRMCQIIEVIRKMNQILHS